ncbi:lateral signaling target protein 2 homolog isoform X2 [Corticium candelabrum]|uniref:lateral signaling target protein 2 homolog isoform X2 n=1 Tax=Corticium candelabrum TaxID=121492 RepID=UPI002E25D854|nr:lateral signaling target protein 2 homolog isoform X2 [Corticium candelabrum]
MAMTTAVRTPSMPPISAFKKFLNKPKTSDPHTLALFYHANEATKRMETQLVKSRRRGSGVRDVLRHVRHSQQALMDIIMQCVEEAVPETERASRDFRVKYPDDMVMESLNGGLWQSAEILASGQSIVNRRDQSTEIRPLARQTILAIGAVREALTRQALVCLTDYSPETTNVLSWFDHVWVQYEYNYVSNMCPIFTVDQFEQLEECIVMFSEATQRAVKLGYLSQDMLETYDPILMFSIPRLAIVCGLVVFPRGPLDLERKFCDIPGCFRINLSILARIRELLLALDSSEFTMLEKALCSAEGIGELARDVDGKPVRVASTKKAATDSHPEHTIQESVDQKQTTEESQENTNDREETVIKQTPEETARIRSAFNGSQDLLHRLFVAISGIADQLQSNHARDMRLILKSTFAVCEDPVPVRKNIDNCGDIVPSDVVSETVVDNVCETQYGQQQQQNGKKTERHFASGEADVSADVVNVSERASVQGPLSATTLPPPSRDQSWVMYTVYGRLSNSGFSAEKRRLPLFGNKTCSFQSLGVLTCTAPVRLSIMPFSLPD